MSERKPWHKYYLDLAEAAATRSTCDRKHVGCVLVSKQCVVSTGYNGSVRGAPHCDDDGHDLLESIGPDGKVAPNCVRTVHAEQNAVAQAARTGVALEGAFAYVNTYPCWNCYKLLVNAGIAGIVYRAEYRKDLRVEDAMIDAGVFVLSETQVDDAPFGVQGAIGALRKELDKRVPLL